jgi:hypothetical protein
MRKIIWTMVTVLVMFLVFHAYANAQEHIPQWELIGKSDKGELVYVDIKSAVTQKEPKYSCAWFKFAGENGDVLIRFYSTFETKAVCYDQVIIGNKVLLPLDKPCLIVQKDTIGEEIFKSLIILYTIKERK